MDSVTSRMGGGRASAEDIDCGVFEAYVADLLGLKPHELSLLPYEQIIPSIGYKEGARIAEWASSHPAGTK